MATQSSILAWETLMDRGAWWATVHGVESDTTEHTHTQTQSSAKLVIKASFLYHCNSTLLCFPEVTTFEFLQLIFMKLSPCLQVIYIHYVCLIFPSWALSTDFLLWQVQSWFSFIPLHLYTLYTIFSSSCSQYNYTVLWMDGQCLQDWSRLYCASFCFSV